MKYTGNIAEELLSVSLVCFLKEILYNYTVFLLTGLCICTGEYKAKAQRLYRYASQLVRSLLPD